MARVRAGKAMERGKRRAGPEDAEAAAEGAAAAKRKSGLASERERREGDQDGLSPACQRCFGPARPATRARARDGRGVWRGRWSVQKCAWEVYSLRPRRLELQAVCSAPRVATPGSGGRQSTAIGLKLFTVRVNGSEQETERKVAPGGWYAWF